MTGVLASLDPSYKELVNEDGTCVVQVVKGLYGLVEAAKLWYDKLSSMLTSLGFTPNHYDPCVFNRQGPAGQTTLTMHVDNVMIATPSEFELDGLLKELEEHYSELTVNRGRVLNHLGMVFDFKTEMGNYGRICGGHLEHLSGNLRYREYGGWSGAIQRR
jgi:hypothetical protein